MELLFLTASFPRVAPGIAGLVDLLPYLLPSLIYCLWGVLERASLMLWWKDCVRRAGGSSAFQDFLESGSGRVGGLHCSHLITSAAGTGVLRRFKKAILVFLIL